MVAVLGGIQVVDQGVGQLGEDRAQIGAGPAGGLVVRVLDGREGAGVPVLERSLVRVAFCRLYR